MKRKPWCLTITHRSRNLSEKRQKSASDFTEIVNNHGLSGELYQIVRFVSLFTSEIMHPILKLFPQYGFSTS